MKKSWIVLAVVLALLTGCAIYLQISKKNVPVLSAPLEVFTDDNSVEPETEPAAEAEMFKNYGPAPEFAGISKWINTDPLTMANQKGKVTLVTFWNYSSINSVRAFPNMTKWQNEFKDKGLQIVSVHTPEFAFEKVTANVENAVKAHHLNYPIAVDNEYKTWLAYRNQFWPAYYLIDKDGNLVYSRVGEGQYDDIEKALKILLGLEGTYTTPPLAEGNQAKTPEIHLGLARQTNFASNEKALDSEQIYTLPKKVPANKFAVEGKWKFDQEAAILSGNYGRIKLNFDAAKVYLVAESPKPVTVKVYVDGQLVKGVVVTRSELYQLYDSLVGGNHNMEIEIPQADFKAFTFTFG